MSFPELTSGACAAKPPTATCYTSDNDVSGLSVNALSIALGLGYSISGDAVTLGSGGITTSPSSSASNAGAFSYLFFPVTLSAPQVWAVNGGPGPTGQPHNLVMDGDISGATDTLGIEITQPTALYFDADAEVGAVSVTGSGIVAVGEGEPPNVPFHLGSLNATDGNPISLLGEARLFAVDGEIGPLTAAEHSTIRLGETEGPGILAVEGSVTLSSAATVLTFINHKGTVAGSDYSQLTASGTVALAGAALHLNDGDDCGLLEPGNVDTLIATTGSITGTFKDIPNGTTIPLECKGEGRTPTATIDYSAHEVTATIETPGATATEREEEARRLKEEAAATKKHEEEAKKGEGDGETSRGSTDTSTARVASTPSTPPLAPIFAQRQTVSVISGTVTVLSKGTAKPLSGTSTILDGSEVEATNGRVLITVATPNGHTQSAEIWGGRFLVHQERTGLGETHFVLSLPLTGCPRVALPRGAAAALMAGAKPSSGPKSRHLWVSEGGGSWGTNGRYVSTSVEGTRWLTLDECNQSEVRVAAGNVKVHNLVRNTTKVLTAGKRYVARAGLRH